MSLEKDTLKGQIERITYHNPENGYTVAQLKLEEGSDIVSIVGNLPSPEPGQIIVLEGEWVIDSRYGEQFEFDSYSYDVPVTKEGIEKYLGSGLIPGIGPVMASRIVDKFGDRALEIIDENPERLKEVEGIGQKRYKEIKKSWREQKQVREIMVFLLSQGISPNYSAKIFEEYGQESINIVKENPYRLARDIWGIGFKRVDDIAQNLGIGHDDEVRIEAGLNYILNEAVEEGHVYLPEKNLLSRAEEVLEVNCDKIKDVTGDMYHEEKLIREKPENNLFDKAVTAVYLPAFYYAEEGIAEKLTELIAYPNPQLPAEISQLINSAENNLNIQLSQEQRAAVEKAAEDRLVIVTGGPGTGKTTIIEVMLEVFDKLSFEVSLAAPTGRAAKRMEETTQREAETIHRLLDFNYHEGGFNKNQDNQLEKDIIIIDEASMLDTMLMYNLVRAIPPQTGLILVGDVNQLPPVGAGYVLRDLLDSGVLPVAKLTEIYRQAEESSIIVNSHRINSGKMPILNSKTESELKDFYFIEEDDKENILQLIIKIVSERIPQRFNLDPVEEVQVLSPMHRGLIGIGNLNRELKSVLNPGHKDKTLQWGSREFKEDDKVMQIKNNYDLEVFNGDIGKIKMVQQKEGKMVVNFSGRDVIYEGKDLEQLRLAYAITVHKSQGSEYSAVVLPVSTQHYIMLQRKLIYTALTRARDLAVLIGSKKALGIAVNNNEDEQRFSLLDERIQTKL